MFSGCLHVFARIKVKIYLFLFAFVRFYYQTLVMMGYSAEGLGQRARLCLISDSIFWLYYFIPTLVIRCNALPKKVPKELYKRKRQQQIRDEDVSFILSFIYWVQQPFHGWGSFSWIHWNGWIPQLSVKNTLIVSCTCLSTFGISGFHKG